MDLQQKRYIYLSFLVEKNLGYTSQRVSVLLFSKS